jgi:hypothetical protein
VKNSRSDKSWTDHDAAYFGEAAIHKSVKSKKDSDREKIAVLARKTILDCGFQTQTIQNPQTTMTRLIHPPFASPPISSLPLKL